MNKLWKYEAYVELLSHENEIVRHWSLSALENHFTNRFTDQVASLIEDDNDHLVCSALRYLSFHKSVQHAPAILERFKSSQGIVSSNCAAALGKMHYESAIDVMLERFSTTKDSETFFGILTYLGSIPSEKCRLALKSAVIQMQENLVLGAAIENLLHHYNPEDLDLVMERCLDSGDSYNRHDTQLSKIVAPLGGGAYFKNLTKYGKNEILSAPSKTIDDLILTNEHLTIDKAFCESLISSLKKRQYEDFTAALLFDARTIINARYFENDNPDFLEEVLGQDTMCLHLLEGLSKRRSLWDQSSNAYKADLISFAISAYFAIKERGAYIKALQPEADIEALITTLQNSGPCLPRQIQDKIKALAPIPELQKALSKDLRSWGDIWTVRLMGRIGSKEFAPDLIRALRDSDSLDVIYDDALGSINTLDESADESILTAIKNGEVDDWASFAILENLPYAQAYELALDRWENPSGDGMDSYESYAHCLRGIGDRRGIKKLQDIYANENDATFIGDSLECLSEIHMVDIPELPDIIQSRKEQAARQKDRMKKLNDLFKNYSAQKAQTFFKTEGEVTPLNKKTVKIGRNAPCPCGSGKKYKKCCLNK